MVSKTNVSSVLSRIEHQLSKKPQTAAVPSGFVPQKVITSERVQRLMSLDKKQKKLSTSLNVPITLLQVQNLILPVVFPAEYPVTVRGLKNLDREILEKWKGNHEAFLRRKSCFPSQKRTPWKLRRNILGFAMGLHLMKFHNFSVFCLNLDIEQCVFVPSSVCHKRLLTHSIFERNF